MRDKESDRSEAREQARGLVRWGRVRYHKAVYIGIDWEQLEGLHQ